MTDLLIPPQAALTELLSSLFQTNSGMRLFLLKLPEGHIIEKHVISDHIPRAGLAFDTVQVLERHGLITRSLFDALLGEFPQRHREIRAVAQACAVTEPLGDAPAGAADEEHHSGLLLDNFLLQDVARLIHQGLPTVTSARIDIDPARDTHRYSPVPAAVVSIHSLLSFLTELVLRDRLWLDQDYAGAWQQVSVGVDALADSDILRVKKMTLDWKNFKEARQIFLDDMCITSSLRDKQATAEDETKRKVPTSDSVHSVIFWGTAGNIARSDVLGLPYSPHPLRKHLLGQTSYSANDATAEVEGWVQRERGRLFERVHAGRRRRTARMILPPVAALVMAEARDTSQLISVALQVRERFAPLREWLAIHQQALYIEDPDQLQQCSRFLDGLEAGLRGAPTLDDYARSCVALCAQMFSNSIVQGRRLDAAIQLGQLVFAKKGEALLREHLRKLDSSPSQTQQILENMDALTLPAS